MVARDTFGRRLLLSETLIGVMAGVMIGGALVAVVVMLRRRGKEEKSRRLVEEAQRQHAAELSQVLEQVKTAFAALSRDALSHNSDDFLKLAKTQFGQLSLDGAKTLDEKKKLIDVQLDEIGQKLRDMSTALQSVEQRHVEQYGSMKSQVEQAMQATLRLDKTAADLRAALSNPQRRGQWGERMAEDVLRLAGLKEGFSYLKQTQIGDGTRPDYTFLLPDHRCIHMDVKFPLARFLDMTATDDPARRDALSQQFIRDARSRIKEVTTRDYIDPASGTVDYVLVFIPNEHVYHFIHEHDPSLLDDALRNKVVLCSPVTLYAILAVIRQAIDNFHLERGARQILTLLDEFKKQWGKYVESMDKLGERLDAAVKTFEELKGARTRQLERQLDKIDGLRHTPQEPSVLPALEQND